MPSKSTANTTWKIAAVVFVLLAGAYIMARMFVLQPMLDKFEERKVQMYGGYGTANEARAALKSDPDDASAYVTLAHDAEKQHKWDDALKNWRDAARLDPENGYTQWSLAAQLMIKPQHRAEGIKVLSALSKTRHPNAPIAAHLLEQLNENERKFRVRAAKRQIRPLPL